MGKKLIALLLALVMTLSLAVSAAAVNYDEVETLNVSTIDKKGTRSDLRTVEKYMTTCKYVSDNEIAGIEEIYTEHYRGEGAADDDYIPQGPTDENFTGWDYTKDDYTKKVTGGVTENYNVGWDLSSNDFFRLRWSLGKVASNAAVAAAGDKGVNCPSEAYGMIFVPADGNWKKFGTLESMKADGVEWKVDEYLYNKTNRTDKALPDGGQYSEFSRLNVYFDNVKAATMTGLPQPETAKTDAMIEMYDGRKDTMEGWDKQEVTSEGKKYTTEYTTITYNSKGTATDLKGTGVTWIPTTATVRTETGIDNVAKDGTRTYSTSYETWTYDCNGFENPDKWTLVRYEEGSNKNTASVKADGSRYAKRTNNQQYYECNGSATPSDWKATSYNYLQAISDRKVTNSKTGSYTMSSTTVSGGGPGSQPALLQAGLLQGKAPEAPKATKSVDKATFDGKVLKGENRTYEGTGDGPWTLESGEWELSDERTYTTYPQFEYSDYDHAEKTIGQTKYPKNAEKTSTDTTLYAVKYGDILPLRLVKVSGVNATADTDGWKDYYEDMFTGELYEDAKGENPIADLDEWKLTDGRIDAGSRCKYLSAVYKLFKIGKILAVKAAAAAISHAATEIIPVVEKGVNLIATAIIINTARILLYGFGE